MRQEGASPMRDGHSHQMLKLMREQKYHEDLLGCKAESGAQCSRHGGTDRWGFSLAKKKSGKGKVCLFSQTRKQVLELWSLISDISSHATVQLLAFGWCPECCHLQPPKLHPNCTGIHQILKHCHLGLWEKDHHLRIFKLDKTPASLLLC